MLMTTHDTASIMFLIKMAARKDCTDKNGCNLFCHVLFMPFLLKMRYTSKSNFERIKSRLLGVFTRGLSAPSKKRAQN